MAAEITVNSRSRNELIDITPDVSRIVQQAGIDSGVCVVFTPHTTAAVTINENADPTVQSDLLRKLSEVFPQRDGYRHAEGNSDAHIKSSLIGCSEVILIEEGNLQFGTWQGIYFCEFDGPRRRRVLVKLLSG